MRYKVVVSGPAANDLEQITAYIATQLHNRKAAADFLDKIDRQTDGLRNNPRLYGLSKNSRLAEKGYHKMPIVGTRYLVIYRINDAEKKVIILRVFYVQRNYEALL